MSHGFADPTGTASAASGHVYNEVPTGTRPGTSFTLDNVPVAGSVKLRLRHLWLTEVTSSPSFYEYTISGASITTFDEVQTDDDFRADYDTPSHPHRLANALLTTLIAGIFVAGLLVGYYWGTAAAEALCQQQRSRSYDDGTVAGYGPAYRAGYTRGAADGAWIMPALLSLPPGQQLPVDDGDSIVIFQAFPQGPAATWARLWKDPKVALAKQAEDAARVKALAAQAAAPSPTTTTTTTLPSGAKH